MRRHDPTVALRRTVRTMAGFGVPHTEIATFLGIDAKTLREQFRDELDRGMTQANAKVAQSLFRMAAQGKNVAAAIFWMNARAGWRERHDPKGDDPSDGEAKRIEVQIVNFTEPDRPTTRTIVPEPRRLT